MEESAYELEVITPLIMKGAEDYELRVPSIKGVMRFWFRAMIGCLAESTEDLYKIESSIFGGQDKKSDVTIKILDEKNLISMEDSQFYKNYPYLLFAYKEKIERLKYIKENSSFAVSVCTSDEDKQNIVKAVFDLISLFGGLGQRTRRGFGSVMLKDFTIKDENDFVEKFGSIYKKLNEYLKNHPELKSTRGDYDKRDFSTFCGGKFCFVKSETSPESALRYLNDNWGRFRKDQKYKEKEEGRLYERRKYFGLPLKGYNTESRRSSPLLFKIIKSNKKRYDIVSLFLNANKLIERELLDETIVEEYFDYLKRSNFELKVYDFSTLLSQG